MLTRSDDPTAPPYAARLLPEHEWTRLPAEIQQALTPNASVVVVVEDPQGAIVARWIAMNVVHLEGLFAEPAVRGHAVVAKLLLTEMHHVLTFLGIPSVVTIAQDDLVRTLARKAGFVDVPGTLHRWDLPCPQPPSP